jgi:hypothetical protein
VASTEAASTGASCVQRLDFAFFFDGTGNNRDADTPTLEQSNVARMFDAHLPNDQRIGRYAIYIPGIGTYFPEIGDPGGTTSGLAFGAEGDKRLDWAMNQFNEKLAYHVAQAQNPTNKITSIRVAAFGFSRGATLARAFARRFQSLCTRDGAGWKWTAGGYPVRFYFLGVWDTVASVGLPMSFNNTPVAESAGWMSTATAMRMRNQGDNGVRLIAFGRPGADPAPGPANGHMGWGDPIDIAPMVEQCIHMVAGHEIRNSFPVDSCQRDGRYPNGVEEMVYPGVHSDVGGGYRPGEGARSAKPGQMLSLIPLRAMYDRARTAGVPLYALNQLPSDKLKTYFALDDGSAAEFSKMLSLWRHYMDQTGWGGEGIGQMMNRHMRQYYAWRFHKIRLNLAARQHHQPTADEAVLSVNEAQWDREKKDLKRRMVQPQAEMEAAQRRLQVARDRLDRARQSAFEYGTQIDPSLEQAVAQAEGEARIKSDEYLRLKARLDTLPGTEGELARALAVYDNQLLADAEAIRAQHLAEPSLPLRPHYRNLLEAYEAEFIHDNGLRDEAIIEFFDTYVHDSLAGFARDATLPSDPRVVYVGGNVKSRHAMLHRSAPETELAQGEVSDEEAQAV